MTCVQPAQAQALLHEVLARPAGGSAQFARYVTPRQCEQAAGRLYLQYWRARRRDTVVYAPLTDSVPAPVREAVQLCLDRFSIATVPVSELRSLAQVALWTGQDSIARHVMDRLMQAEQAKPAVDRGWTLYLWIDNLLSARPLRSALARTYLAQVDALGAPAATWRLFTHTRYADRALSMNDRATAESEGRAALAASRQMSRDDRLDWVLRIEDAYLAAAEPLALTHGGATALALLDTMALDLTPLRPQGTSERRELLARFAEVRVPFTLLGHNGIAPVRANAWYGAPGDTVFPKPGRLALIFFIYGPDYPTFATIRRLHERYGAQGLDIVLMTSTHGYFRNLPMPDPAVEADSMGSYLRNYLHLPVTVAAERTTFTHVEDGRRRNVDTPNMKAYGHIGGAVLIDRHDVVRWIGNPTPSMEAVWDAVIAAALPR